MKNVLSLRTDTSNQSFAAFDTQAKTSKSKISSVNSSLSKGSSKDQSSRMEEINAKDWHLSEKLAKDYDRTFNNVKPRSLNFQMNVRGSHNFVNFKAEEQKLKTKFEKHRELRVRDFQSNINTLPNPENLPSKNVIEKEFPISPKQKFMLSTKIYESFYFKPSSVATKENEVPQDYRTYKNSAKQFELPNRKKDLAKHNFIFHGNNVF
jgi:hypothetical protein